jgi:hypothetical protein
MDNLHELLCQIDCITLNHHIKVEVAPSQEQITHHPADEIKSLPSPGRNLPGGVYKTGQLGWQPIFYVEVKIFCFTHF